MASKIFLWVGHPRATSLCSSLADAYQRGAEAQGAEGGRMDLHGMEFDPDLTGGYGAQKKLLEPDLFDWQQNIKWAEHLCWVYPYWWGGMPAKMKGVIDRAYLPGFAFKYHDKGPWWDRYLTDKTADVILTAETPGWWDWIMYGKPGRRQVTNLVLKFAGVKVTSVSQFAPVKGAKPETFDRWMKRAHFYGAEAGRR